MLIKERSKNKQLAINMSASVITFVVGIGINFFLTPFIVNTLGAAAYGFVGLSNNIISYTGLFTIALNSMSGRFITIAYARGEVEKANKYFSSVYYSNLILSAIILVSMMGCVVYLDKMLEIPPELISDVKTLFSFLVLNTILGMMTNVYAIATFIKNRLELSSIRTIIGSIVRAIVLVGLFGFFIPKLWYLGMTSIIVTLYCAYTNYRYALVLTPDLKIRRKYFDFAYVKELIISGSWNVISKLNEMLAQGLDLVVANLLIGATAMGVLSITKIVPNFVYSFFGTVASVFAPNLTTTYADGNMEEMRHQLIQTIRIMGFIATIPVVCLYSFGYEFYTLWVPTQNAWHLYILTILGTFASIFSMPLEGLWNIFTITNKIKYTSLFLLALNVVSFVCIVAIIPFVDDLFLKLCVFSAVRLAFSFVKNFFFLPLFGAKCLSFKWTTFYPAMMKSVFCFAIAFTLCYCLHILVEVDDWIALIIMCGLSVFVCISVNSFIILTKSDRKLILSKIRRK